MHLSILIPLGFSSILAYFISAEGIHPHLHHVSHLSFPFFDFFKSVQLTLDCFILTIKPICIYFPRQVLSSLPLQLTQLVHLKEWKLTHNTSSLGFVEPFVTSAVSLFHISSFNWSAFMSNTNALHVIEPLSITQSITPDKRPGLLHLGSFILYVFMSNTSALHFIKPFSISTANYPDKSGLLCLI